MNLLSMDMKENEIVITFENAKYFIDKIVLNTVLRKILETSSYCGTFNRINIDLNDKKNLAALFIEFNLFDSDFLDSISHSNKYCKM